MGQGILLAIEGIDGAGTTTQTGLLMEHLASRGRHAVQTAEPSRGPIGKLARAALANEDGTGDDTLALLFAADRLDHLTREITPALIKGAVVVSDRYLLSSLAYQSTRLPLAWVESLNARAKKPDASILIKVDPAIALERRRKRGGAVERFDDDKHQRAIAEAYDALFARRDLGPTYVIDGNPEPRTVARAVADLVDRLIG